MILVLDNRDSFVFNLARYVELLGVNTAVHSSHALDTTAIARLAPRAIIISPGPCTPAEAGCSVAAVQAFRGRVPILGVCLGHQAIAAALGATIIRAREPVHGRASLVHHDAVNLFAGIESPMTAARYHSLVVDPATLPPGLAVTARDDEGTVMAIEHGRDRLWGVQFHPESILTPAGFRLLANFLDMAGIPHSADIPSIESQHAPRPPEESPPDRVVTF